MKTLHKCDNAEFGYDISTDSFVYTRVADEKPIIIGRTKFLESYMEICGEDKFGKSVISSIPGIFRHINKTIKINPDDDTLALFPYNVEFCDTCTENSEFLILPKSNNKLYCLDCFLALKVCKDCGELVEEGDCTEIDGEFVCQSCIQDYTQCDNCGDWLCMDDTSLVYNGPGNQENYICESCLRQDYYRCEDCGDYHSNDTAISLANGGTICQTCYENSYFTCESCGDVYHTDAMMSGGDYYCQSCYDERHVSIHPHWSKLDPIFHGNGPLFFGIEQEIDDGGDQKEAADAIMESIGNSNLYIETDGSLNDEGLELVYFPRSWKSWTEFSEKLEKVKIIARDFSYLAHETKTCGLHVHVSRAAIQSDEFPDIKRNIGKMMLLYEKHFPSFQKFSRRRNRDLQEWACNNPLGYDKTASAETYYSVAEEEGSRYRAINIKPRETVEFRIFRGTLLPGTILASIGLCYNMVQLAISKTQEEIEKLEFDDIVNFDNGTNYVKDYWKSRIAR